VKLVFTDEARADRRIGDHIAKDSARRTLSFVAEIEARCRVPATPLAYPLVPRYEVSGIRRLVHGNYLVFYRVEEDAVTIIHVLDGAMNCEPLLFAED